MSGGPTAPVVFQGAPDDSLTTPNEITGLVRMAIENKVDVTVLERIVALHERVSDRAAASEFFAQLADFQRNCPAIPKTKKASYPSSGGGVVSYSYADLNQIVNVVGPLLQERGFSYTWDSEMSKERGLLSATCTLRHVNGHSEKATFTCPVESKAGMSEQGKHASALSYARRYALIQVLGLTTVDPDEDGDVLEPITAEQVAELMRLADEVSADEKKFLSYMFVTRFEDITRGSFTKAKVALQSKKRARK